MKITEQQLRRLIKNCLTEGEVIHGPWGKKSEKLGPMGDDGFFVPPGIPVRDISGDAIVKMINDQLMQLVHRDGDDTYRDDFLTSLNRILRINAIEVYVKGIAQTIRERQTHEKVSTHPVALENDLLALADNLDSFLRYLRENPEEVHDDSLNRHAAEVIDQLAKKSMGYIP